MADGKETELGMIFNPTLRIPQSKPYKYLVRNSFEGNYLLPVITTLATTAFIHIDPTGSTLAVAMYPNEWSTATAIDAPSLIMGSASVSVVLFGLGRKRERLLSIQFR